MKNLNLKNLKKISFLTSIAVFSMLVLSVANPVFATGSTVTRSFSLASPAPGSTLTVSLNVNILPPDNTSPNDFYLIDEVVPSGWTVTSATAGGDFTSQVGHVKWTVLSGAVSQTDSYTITVPTTASGINTFSGQYGFGSTINVVPPPTVLPSILGDTSVTVTASSGGGGGGGNTATLSSVSTISNINVANGTVLASVGLPATVGVVLSDATTSAYPVTWDSGAPAYNATTAGTYVFTGTLTLASGVTNPNNLTSKVNVIVAAAVVNPVLTSINVVPSNPSVIVGGTQQFMATALDQNNTPLVSQPAFTWSSSDATSTIVSLSANGLATGIAVGGPITITATSGGILGNASITVTDVLPTPALATINVTPTNPSITIGSNQQFTATTLDQGGASFNATVTWSSSDSAVATIDQATGIANALTAGTTTITATSGSVIGTTTLTVIANNTSTGNNNGSGGGGNYVPQTPSINYKDGDINRDGKVDVVDFVALMANWGKNEAGNSADINKDNKIDILDFVILMANWDK